MHLERLAAPPAPAAGAPLDAVEVLARFVAMRDVRGATTACGAVAKARFDDRVVESARAFEVALDALALATAREGGDALGARAARVIAACARGRRFREDAFGSRAATRCAAAFAERRRGEGAATASALALAAIGSEESFEALVVLVRSGIGAVAFETPSSALEYAYAYAYGVAAERASGTAAASALLEAWERVDVGDEYAVLRKCLFGGRSLRRVLESVVTGGAVPKANADVVVAACAKDGRCGAVYVLSAMYRSSVALNDEAMRASCGVALMRSVGVLERWIACTARDPSLEARAFASVSTISACLDMDGQNGPLQSVRAVVARATCKIFALMNVSLLQSLARGRDPREASRILEDLTTSPIYMNAHFIAEAVSRDDGLDPRQSLPMLMEFSRNVYDTAQELAASECAGWTDTLDNSVVRAARANIYDFALITLKNALRGRLEAHVGDAMFVLSHLEFARSTSLEYAQVLGALATLLNSLPSSSDAPAAMAFLASLPELAGDAWRGDKILGARMHLILRLLPFALSKFTTPRIIVDVCPYVRRCCDHEAKHVVKAAHVAYVGIFHARPELNGQLFPDYLRMSLERYPASTPFEPLVAAVGLVTKFGEAGSELALFVARELSEKVKNMDAAPPTMSSEDPPVEPLRRLLFQLVTLVDFPLIPVIQDILEDAVLDSSDPFTRARRHETLAYTVMRCPDYARKPMMVDWVMQMNSKL